MNLPPSIVILAVFVLILGSYPVYQWVRYFAIPRFIAWRKKNLPPDK